MAYRDWDPEEAMALVRSEVNYSLSPDDTPTTHTDPANARLNDPDQRAQAAERIAARKLRENVAYAVDSIIWLALNSENESTRLRAASYLVDRVLGRINDAPMHKGGYTNNSKLNQLLEGVVTVTN